MANEKITNIVEEIRQLKCNSLRSFNHLRYQQAKYQRQHNGQRRYQQNRSLNCILNHGILSFLGFVLDMSRRLSIVSTHTISSLWLIRTKEAVYFFVVLLLCA